eukprot:tig00001333_g8204.t1
MSKKKPAKQAPAVPAAESSSPFNTAYALQEAAEKAAHRKPTEAARLYNEAIWAYNACGGDADALEAIFNAAGCSHALGELAKKEEGWLRAFDAFGSAAERLRLAISIVQLNPESLNNLGNALSEQAEMLQAMLEEGGSPLPGPSGGAAPPSPRSLLHEASDAYARAAACYEDGETDPEVACNHAAVLARLAEREAREGRAAEAAGHMDAADSLYGRAVAQLERERQAGRLSEAEWRAEASDALISAADAQHRAAEALGPEAEARCGRACATLDRLLELRPRDSDALTLYGDALSTRADAIARAAAALPEPGRGEELRRADEVLKAACRRYEAALRISLGDFEASAGLGDALLARAKLPRASGSGPGPGPLLEAAARAYEAALRTRRDDDVLYNLAATRALSGALDACRAALASLPPAARGPAALDPDFAYFDDPAFTLKPEASNGVLADLAKSRRLLQAASPYVSYAAEQQLISGIAYNAFAATSPTTTWVTVNATTWVTGTAAGRNQSREITYLDCPAACRSPQENAYSSWMLLDGRSHVAESLLRHLELSPAPLLYPESLEEPLWGAAGHPGRAAVPDPAALLDAGALLSPFQEGRVLRVEAPQPLKSPWRSSALQEKHDAEFLSKPASTLLEIDSTGQALVRRSTIRGAGTGVCFSDESVGAVEDCLIEQCQLVGIAIETMRTNPFIAGKFRLSYVTTQFETQQSPCGFRREQTDS